MNLKTHTAQTDSTSHTFLTGAILFANLDYSGFGAYAIKAAIGGAIWMVFKIAGELLSSRLGNKKKADSETAKEEN